MLKKILPNQQDQRGKWAPNWDGPYVVKRAFAGGALILSKMDGNDLPSLINSDVVKKKVSKLKICKGRLRFARRLLGLKTYKRWFK